MRAAPSERQKLRTHTTATTRKKSTETAARKLKRRLSTRDIIPQRAATVILRYSEESGRCVGLCRCFGVPQHDGERGAATVDLRLFRDRFVHFIDLLLGDGGAERIGIILHHL